MTKDAENLISDLREVSRDLAEWAERLLDGGNSPDEIRAKLREAARLAGRA